MLNVNSIQGARASGGLALLLNLASWCGSFRWTHGYGYRHASMRPSLRMCATATFQPAGQPTGFRTGHGLGAVLCPRRGEEVAPFVASAPRFRFAAPPS